MPFDTPLNPAQEGDFLKWKQQHAPYDSGQDYDLRGAFQAGMTPDPSTEHWPDTFKKPNHPTFSDQSIYSSLSGTKPGTWEGEQYKPMGFGNEPHPFWKALEGVVNSIRAPQTSKAPWGMHEPTHTAAEGIGPLAGQVGDTLADPRNAWMGVGPLGVLGRYGKFFRKPTPDMGGFHVPTSTLMKQDPLLENSYHMSEPARRNLFVQGRQTENDIARNLNSQYELFQQEGLKELQELPTHWQNNVTMTKFGQQDLRDEIARAMNSHLGGGVPNKYLGYGDGTTGMFSRPNTRR